MKKNFTMMALVILAMLMSFGSEADAQTKLSLSGIENQEEGDYTFYGYDNMGRLDSVYIYTCYYDDEMYRLFNYDANNNVVKESGYCLLDKDNQQFKAFSKTYDINYAYDENNRIVKRINYNLDIWGGTGEFLLGGVYKYFYDENGVLLKRNLYWDINCTDLFEETDFVYDENGRVLKEEYKMQDFDGTMVEETMLSYEYDEKGRLSHVRTDVRNHETNVMEEDNNIIYKYDANGNLTNRINYATDPNVPNEEHILIYDTDKLASDVVMPINREDDMDFFTRSTNVVKQDSIYKLDVEGVLFDLYDVLDWSYTEIDVSAGIDNVIGSRELFAISKDAEGNLILNGVATNENVRIYDANGNLISNGTYNGKINVGGLPRGMYIVSTRKGSVKICR